MLGGKQKRERLHKNRLIALVEMDLVGVRSLLFSQDGGLCDVLFPAMMASTCRNNVRPLQKSADLLGVFERGEAENGGASQQIDRQILHEWLC